MTESIYRDRYQAAFSHAFLINNNIDLGQFEPIEKIFKVIEGEF